MKRILGLDLGTNSIGWAIVNQETENEKTVLTSIEKAGSRIIPMDAAMMGDFEKGNSISQTAERTRLRGVRRLRERALLRRERLHRVLKILDFLPPHYATALTRYGKFSNPDVEVKLPWTRDDSGKPIFLFQSSFDEMLKEFKQVHPEMLADGKKIPYDWTIYYLHKKAISQPITRQELSWILLQFNQKRGYYQLRGEEESEEDSGKNIEYIKQRVVRVEATDERKGDDVWYNVYLENGMIYRRTSKTPLEWVGLTKEFIVTTTLDENGQPKRDAEGNIRRTFKLPSEGDWTLLKKRTESDLEASGKYVGTFIYDAILENPSQKIIGKLIRVIERKYYKQELRAILECQKQHIPELTNNALYQKCIHALYESNDTYRQSIEKKNFTYLFVDDILFYQRPLKSKKSLIDDCQYETRTYKDKNGVQHTKNVKCIAKSAPLFQEFRLWQFISNLRIIQRECYEEIPCDPDLFGNYETKRGSRLQTDVDVTNQFLRSEDDYTALFDWLNERATIKQDTLLTSFFKMKKNQVSNYRWNYVEDKEYPCNTTRASIIKYMAKAGVNDEVLNQNFEEKLWHILYSIEGKEDSIKALTKFAEKHQLPQNFIDTFSKFPPFKKEYGSYSSKAISKLLPVMRMGKYWSPDAIDANTLMRVNKIIDGEYDENIDNRTREKLSSFTDIGQLRGLPVWLACYVVYGRHSEAKEVSQWKAPEDIDVFLKEFRQHSMHNPIVEQVIMETMRTVRDIWKEVGQIDEIHVEMGREMKQTAAERYRRTQQIHQNEITNLRIKALLVEFMNPDCGIENVRPYSPSQQELLKIYEEGVLTSQEPTEEIAAILKKFEKAEIKNFPTHSEVLRYKLWLEQNYFSPYTGKIIPLAKLFTPAYEIEHIIPQSRYFDDSLSNKVICEAEVNKLKDRQLGYEFITNHGGEVVQLSGGGSVTILTSPQYEKFVKEHYGKNKAKMRKLLMEDIPDGFIERQLNDSRYISKYIISLLSNIVRRDDEREANVANIITCTGGITDRLKQDWGINDKWNEIILPRFKRLNEMEQSSRFTAISAQGHEIPTMPLELQLGFSKKRIDHRHHAMDAIIIACASRNIVNYLNNESAMSGAKISRQDLKHLLCHKNTDGSWIMNLPWESFPEDCKTTLQNIIVSFKQNLRVINKTSNKYQIIKDGRKISESQVTGDSWAIRKSMHQDTVYGEVNLQKIKSIALKEALKTPERIVNHDLKAKIQEMLQKNYTLKQMKAYFEEEKDTWSDVNINKIEVYYYTKETDDRYFATRKAIDGSFDSKRITESITDTGIQQIMLAHLKKYDDREGKEHPELAFSPEGIDMMNKTLRELNHGRQHQPIYKVRVYEKAERFAVGQTGNKKAKFVEAAKGTNLFFAIYEKEVFDKAAGEMVKCRTFASIPLNVAINREKQGLSPAPEDEEGNAPKYILSPGNLVYVPRKGEVLSDINLIDRNRIYKVVSFSGNRLWVIPYNVACMIVDKCEYTMKNKIEFTEEKQQCIPITVNRLGNIIHVGK